MTPSFLTILLFNLETHLLTLIFVILELMLLTCQLFYYYSRPQDKRRLWFLILLALLIFYNISSRLFPDLAIAWISLKLQQLLAYGTGFFMAAYFPWYFYKAFNLPDLRFHLLYAAGIFLVLPDLVFLGFMHPLTGDVDFTMHLGVALLLVYAWVLIWSIRSAVRNKIKFKPLNEHPYVAIEIYAVCFAVIPWICLSVFSVLPIQAWIEALITNLGLVCVSILYMIRSVALNRMEHAQFLAFAQAGTLSFERNCKAYKLTDREVEIAALLCKGMTYQEIADLLFIARKTVDTHAHNIFEKTKARRRMQLLQILGFAEDTKGGC